MKTMLLSPEEVAELTEFCYPSKQTAWLWANGFIHEIGGDGEPKLLRTNFTGPKWPQFDFRLLIARIPKGQVNISDLIAVLQNNNAIMVLRWEQRKSCATNDHLITDLGVISPTCAELTRKQSNWIREKYLLHRIEKIGPERS